MTISYISVSDEYSAELFRRILVLKRIRYNSKTTLPNIQPKTVSDSANDMNTNAYKAAIHKVHERTIYEPSNALPFYVRECGGGWACLESRHKVNTSVEKINDRMSEYCFAFSPKDLKTVLED